MEYIFNGVLFGLGFAFIYKKSNSKISGGGLYDILKKKSSPPKDIPGKGKYESILKLNNKNSKKSVVLQEAKTPEWDVSSKTNSTITSVNDKSPDVKVNKWGFEQKVKPKIENKFSFREEKVKKIKQPTRSLLAMELSK